jgi:hypothetical protein
MKALSRRAVAAPTVGNDSGTRTYTTKHGTNATMDTSTGFFVCAAE